MTHSDYTVMAELDSAIHDFPCEFKVVDARLESLPPRRRGAGMTVEAVRTPEGGSWSLGVMEFLTVMIDFRDENGKNLNVRVESSGGALLLRDCFAALAMTGVVRTARLDPGWSLSPRRRGGGGDGGGRSACMGRRGYRPAPV